MMTRKIASGSSRLACQFLLLSLLMPCVAGGDGAQSAGLRFASLDTSLGRRAHAALSIAVGGQTAPVPVTTATVVKTYPHDPKAFTQGLEYYDGHLYESTG